MRVYWDTFFRHLLAILTAGLLFLVPAAYAECLDRDAKAASDEKAKAYYEKALKIKPNQEEVLHKLIQIYLDFYQDLGAIASCYEHFLNVEKNKAQVFVDYATFLAKYLQDFDFAAIQLQEALSIEPKHLQAKQLLLQLQEQAENTVEYDEQEEEEEEEFEGGGAPDDN